MKFRKTGGHEKRSRSDRLCTLCELNNIKDENHFLFHCPKYSSIRNDFNVKVDNKFPNPTELIVELISEDKFRSLGFDLRNKLLPVSFVSAYFVSCYFVIYVLIS